MKEGYYWIQHQGIVQMAYYTHDKVENMDTGKIMTGVWHLTEGFEICHDFDVEIVGGPLSLTDKS